MLGSAKSLLLFSNYFNELIFKLYSWHEMIEIRILYTKRSIPLKNELFSFT